MGDQELETQKVLLMLVKISFQDHFKNLGYYSHDISQSVFNDAVMNPESIEGNFITGSESSFDIVNFRAPLGNELENIFTSSYQHNILK